MTKTRPTASAFSTFTVNQRVRVQVGTEPARGGIVRGFARKPRGGVRVQIDGHKTVSTYHPAFLSPEAP